MGTGEKWWKNHLIFYFYISSNYMAVGDISDFYFILNLSYFIKKKRKSCYYDLWGIQNFY